MGKRIQRKTEPNGVLMEQLNSAKFSLSPRSNNARERERESRFQLSSPTVSLSLCARVCKRERERERERCECTKESTGEKNIYDAASTSLKFSVNNNCVWAVGERGKGRGGLNLLFCPCFLLIITKLIGIQAPHVIKVDIEKIARGRRGVWFRATWAVYF